MLVRILNTLRSRIWDMVVFLFSGYLNLRLVKSQRSMVFIQIKAPDEEYFLMGNSSLIKNHILPEIPLSIPQNQILISIWSQKTENQKFDIKENVMSEQVKMPNRHFLRSDYLHIFFYIKFLVFVSLVQQIII